MKIHFINVGYGEAILIQKDDFNILIDGGTNRREEYDSPGCIRISDYLKKMSIAQIDLAIVTHIHDDHIGGIPQVLEDFPVYEVWINLKPELPDLDTIRSFESVRSGNISGVLFQNALEGYRKLMELCENKKIPVLQMGKGTRSISPFPDLFLELLSPDPALQLELLQKYEALCGETDHDRAEGLFYDIDRQGNRSSMALRVRAGKTAALLTGDKVDGWDGILNEYGDRLHSQILKVTHHGQKDGLPEEMIRVAQPEKFVICSSRDRRFNSAHPAVIQRIAEYIGEKPDCGVYITGSLSSDSEDGEICAVCFWCNEDTGEVAAGLVAL